MTHHHNTTASREAARQLAEGINEHNAHQSHPVEKAVNVLVGTVFVAALRGQLQRLAEWLQATAPARALRRHYLANLLASAELDITIYEADLVLLPQRLQLANRRAEELRAHIAQAQPRPRRERHAA